MLRNVGAPNPRLNLQTLRNHFLLLLLLLHTPLSTTMLNLLTWRIIGNDFSGLKERLMDTLLGYYWTVERHATLLMKNLFNNTKLSTQGTKSFSVELADGRKKEITQAINIK